MASLEKSGSRIVAASAVARVVLPLPGGPETTMKSDLFRCTVVFCSELPVAQRSRVRRQAPLSDTVPPCRIDHP